MRLNLSLKIETDPSEPEYIVTVPGAGYKSNSFFLLKVVPLFILYIIFTDFIIFTNPPLIMMSCGYLHKQLDL